MSHAGCFGKKEKPKILASFYYLELFDSEKRIIFNNISISNLAPSLNLKLDALQSPASSQTECMREMALNQSSSFSYIDDDYIEMEVMSSSTNFLLYSISSPLHSIDFEFKMSSDDSQGMETITCPADELFYKGKLLPLHLSPRMQMVRKLLQNPTTATFYGYKDDPLEESYAVPFFTSSQSPCTNIDTLLESCNISPSESCRVSSELNPDEYFFEWSNETNSCVRDHPRKSWTEKLKQSSLYQKLRASGAYLKSLFAKSDKANISYANDAGNAEKESNSIVNGFLGKLAKVATKSPSCNTGYERCKFPYTLEQSFEKEIREESFCNQRRSFSGSMKWHSANKCLSFSSTSISSSASGSGSGSSSSSSSFSFSSNEFCDLQLLRRSSCPNSEPENSIEEAIAYCKMSRQTL